MAVMLTDWRVRPRIVGMSDTRLLSRIRIRLVNADAWEAVAALDALGSQERALLADLEREAWA